MIRILLADDHPIVRSGLEQLLGTAGDMQVCATASDGAEAVARYRSERPDLVLMDLRMPVLDGVGATRAILEEDPDARVVVLTSMADDRNVMDALDAGAAGYLLKHSDPLDLLDSIRAAAAGGVPLDPRAARALLDARRRPVPRPHDLSGRELEVLQLVAHGLSNRQVASRLGIAERTVKAHLTRVFNQIGVADRTQAALWAKQHLGPA